MVYLEKWVATSLFLVLFSSLNCLNTAKHLPPLSKDLATVGTVTLKEDHLREYLQLKLSHFPKEWQTEASSKPLYESENLKSLFLKTFDQMIEDELILQYGQKNNLLLSASDLAYALKKQKENYQTKELEVMLTEKDLSQNYIKQHFEKQIQINQVLSTQPFSALKVTETEIKNYYQNHLEDFARQKQVRARHIVTDSLEKAQELLKRLKTEDNFAKLALEHSQAPERSLGGDLGYFSKGQLPQVFDECFNLKSGEVSEILASEYGFHLFKVLDFREAGPHELEDVAEMIYQKLFAQKQKSQYQNWIDTLKKDFPIHIFETNLKTMVL